MLCMQLIKLRKLPIRGDKNERRIKNQKNTRSYKEKS